MPLSAGRYFFGFYLVVVTFWCAATTVFAQPPLPPLVEKSKLLLSTDDPNLLHAMQVKIDVAAPERWTLADGEQVFGSIALHADLEEELITLVQGTRVQHRIPLNDFAEQTRTRISQQIQERRILIQALKELVPISLVEENQPNSLAIGFLNNENGRITYWYMGAIFEAPESELTPSQLKTLRERIKKRDSMPAWKCVGANYPFASKLQGITPLGYSMKGFVQNNVFVEEIEFTVPHGLFVPASKNNALSVFKNSPSNDRWLESAFPKWVYGLDPSGRTMMAMPTPKGPMLEWDVVPWMEPREHTSADKVKRQPFPTTITPQGLALTAVMIKDAVEKKWTVKQTIDHWTDEEIAKREAQWIGNMPAKQLQLCNQWKMQGLTLVRNKFDGLLLHADDNLWHFRSSQSMEVFSVPKKVIHPEYYELGELVNKRIKAFLATHPDPNYPQPNPYRRLIRNTFAGGALPYTKPADPPQASNTPLEEISLDTRDASGQVSKTVLRRIHTHPDDWAFLVGNSSGNAKPFATNVRGLSIVVYETPRSKGRWRSSIPVEGIRRYGFGFLVQVKEKWVFVEEGWLAEPTGDALNIAIGRTEARLQEEEKYRKEPLKLGFDYVLYGILGGVPVMGKDAKLQSNGKFNYTDLNDTPTSVSQYLTMPQRGEYLFLAKVLERQKKEVSPSAASPKTISPDERLSMYKEIDKIIADHWPMEIVFQDDQRLDAHFECLDGEDVILQQPENDNCFRVSLRRLRKAIVDELQRLESLRKGGLSYYSKRKLDLSSISDRAIRLLDDSFPIIVRNPSLGYDFVKNRFSDNRIEYVPWIRIHPEDLRDLQAYLATKELSPEAISEINAKLTAEVLPSDTRVPLKSVPAEWKRRVDAIATQDDRDWTRRKCDIPGRPVVASFSFDGELLLTKTASGPANNRWMVLQCGSEQSGTPIPIDLDCSESSRFFWDTEHKHLYVSDQGRLTRFRVQLASSKDRWEVTDPTLLSEEIKEVVAATQSLDGKRGFLFCADGNLVVLDLIENKVASQQIVKSPLGESNREWFDCWTNMDGSCVAVKKRNSIDAFLCDSKTLKLTLASSSAAPADVYSGVIIEDVIIYTLPHSTRLHAIPVRRPEEARLPEYKIDIPLIPSHIALRMSKERPEGDFIVFGTPSNKPIGPSNPLMALPMRALYSQLYIPQRIATSGEVVRISGNGERLLLHSGAENTLLTMREVRRTDFGEFDTIASELLQEMKFAELDSIWNYLQSDSMRRKGSYPMELADRFLKAVYMACIRQQGSLPGNLADRFGLVVERWKKVMPESSLPKMMECKLLREIAWGARGTGTINTVSEEGAKIYQDSMRRLVQKIKELLPLELCSDSYHLAFDACMALGLPPTSSDVLQQSFSRSDAYENPHPHHVAVLSLLPRWFGEKGDSEKYIEQVADNLGGEAGDRMYAELLLGAMNYYTDRARVDSYLDCDFGRMERGLKAMSKNALSHHLLQGVEALYQHDRQPQAKELWVHAMNQGVLPHVSTLYRLESNRFFLEQLGLWEKNVAPNR